jgi:hypothetical protein
MLVIRTIVFFAFQALIATILFSRGDSAPWENAAGWWTINATLTNIICLVLLASWLRREQRTLLDLYRFDRRHLWSDLLAVVCISVLMAPLAILPNVMLANLLFDDAIQPVSMMFRPIPHWAAGIALVAFPLTIALAELPTYFGYVMPRLEILTGQRWHSVLLAAFCLAAQHATLPWLPDWRFATWRLLMFVPFALVLGISLRWRPRLLPYFMIIHALLDLQAALMVYSISV